MRTVYKQEFRAIIKKRKEFLEKYLSVYRILLTCLLIFPFLVAVYGSADAASAEKRDKDWTLNLKDVDIRVFLEQVSSITGENFVVDPDVKGKVTVIATTPMDAGAVGELLLTVLRVNGLAAVPSGSTTRIVPLANAKLGSTPGGPGGGGQHIVTRVLSLKNTSVDEAIKLLKPLVSQAGYMEGSEFSNALIISDYADNVNQIVKALAGLDKEGSTDVLVIPLKEAWVGNIVPLIEAVAPMELAEAGKGGRNRLRVVADERSNSIIVRGDPQERQQILKLVETFDQKNSNASDIQMIRLQYADATEVATLLRGMVLNNKAAQGAAMSGNGAAPGASASSASSSPAAPSGAPSGTPSSGLSSSGSSGTSSLGGTPASASPFGAQGGEDLLHTQSFVQPDVMLNALVLRAEPAMMSEIRSLIRQMDVPRSQILIEAAIVEIDADKAEQLGVQLAGGDVAAPINAGTTQFSGIGLPASLPLTTALNQLGNPKALALNSDGLVGAIGLGGRFNILIQALASTTGANLLSTPSIITLDNEEARIVVGQNVPFRTGEFTTQATGTVNPFTTIDRQDIGVTLKVVPQILEGNLVRMNIEQEVSSIAPTTSQTAQAADIITNKREIDTKIVAQNGQTIVLGGLIEDDTNESVSKVPFLGDLPGIGFLFRNKSQSYTKSDLFVFLRPTVLHGVRPVDDVTQERYGRVYDLVIGKKDLANADYATPPVYVPPATTLFNPSAKTLSGLLSDGDGHSTGAIAGVPPPPSAAGELPWLREKKATAYDATQAAPVVPVATAPTPLLTPVPLPWQTKQ
jgi:general secretion pathway protein D